MTNFKIAILFIFITVFCMMGAGLSLRDGNEDFALLFLIIGLMNVSYAYKLLLEDEDTT